MVFPDDSLIPLNQKTLERKELSNIVFGVDMPQNATLELLQNDPLFPIRKHAGHYVLDLVPYEKGMTSITLLDLGVDK